MPQNTSYASMANSGKQSKRIAYYKSMGSVATATPPASPCGSSYPFGPLAYNCGDGSSGFLVYYNSSGQACCVSTSGQKMTCPWCV